MRLESDRATGTLAEMEARCAALGWEVVWPMNRGEPGCLLFYGHHNGCDWPRMACSNTRHGRAALAACMDEAFEALEMAA